MFSYAYLHLCIFFSAVSVKIICPVLTGFFVFLLLRIQSIFKFALRLPFGFMGYLEMY